MAWQETDVLEQKELFIRAWLSGRYTKTDLCGRFGISRPTGDKGIARHFEQGLAGLRERSRRPKTHPNATPQELCEMLVAAKHERPHWGAKKLLDLLRREYPKLPWCADSTGGLILKRAGLCGRNGRGVVRLRTVCPLANARRPTSAGAWISRATFRPATASGVGP